MTGEELRRAYRRVADPFGTPVRAACLPLALAVVAVYLWSIPGSWFRVALLVAVVVIYGYYAGSSLAVRRRGALETERQIRDRFLKEARPLAGRAPSLLVQGAVWLGIGGFSTWGILEGTGSGLTIFLAAVGFVSATRYLIEALVDVPRVRRDLALVESSPAQGLSEEPLD